MAFDAQNTKQMIEDGKAVLGIEFGSTVMIMGSGPIRWRISGQDCRTVTGA